MATDTSFEPLWTSPLEDSIARIVDLRGSSLKSFLDGLELDSLGQILHRFEVDSDEKRLANMLSAALGGTQIFWVNRVQQYVSDQDRLSQSRVWLSEGCYSDLAELGWVPIVDCWERQYQSLLRFFDVESVAEWSKSYNWVSEAVRLRRYKRGPKDVSHLAAWIRRAEMQVDFNQLPSFDKRLLESSVPALVELTNQNHPQELHDRLVETFSVCGVAFVLEDTPRGCPAVGAAASLPNGAPLLLLSTSLTWNDSFWFTLFHEVAHLILHPQEAFIDADVTGSIGDVEQDANRFAYEMLVPPRFEEEVDGTSLDLRSILRLARRVGIAPGILIGQLQFSRRIPYSWFNSLKQRYNWAEITTHGT